MNDINRLAIESFGVWGIIIILLLTALAIVWRKYEATQKDNRDISQKAIEAIVLMQKAQEDNDVQNREIKRKLEELQLTIHQKSCKYG